MIKAIQNIYDIEKKDMEQIRLTKEAALTTGYITKSKWLIEEARQDKEEINMCEAMERYTQRKVEEGKRIGLEQGKLLLVKKLMEKMKMTAKEVMDYLDISQEEQRLMNELLKSNK